MLKSFSENTEVHCVTLIPTGLFNVSLACAGRTSSKRHHTDFFCQVTSQSRFAYKLIQAIPFQVRSHTNLHSVSSVSVHSWVLLHPIIANWLFFLISVAEIRLDCAHGAHTILSNTVPFTASACQLNRSTCPICP